MAIIRKSDIVKHLQKSGFKQADAQSAVETTLAYIEASLMAGDEVNLTNFGKFSVKHRPATKRNVFGEEQVIPEAYQVRFKPGKGLAEAVNV